ncbi:MAG: hypothetical protein ABEJ59_05420 [Halanaeroarchaeum sp.]
MALLPVEEDVLEDVCESIARDNYGFLYVSDHKDEIKSGYESADTGLLKASSVSVSDLREALVSLANDEYRDLEQIRDGVFYFDPFGATSLEGITEELTHLFSQRLVVTAETRTTAPEMAHAARSRASTPPSTALSFIYSGTTTGAT